MSNDKPKKTTRTLPPDLMPSLPEVSDVKVLAEHLHVPEATIYQWNYKGTGPRFHHLGRHVRYFRSDVLEWLGQHAS
jgi:predicted DNA-binding transcriptional regulator AlpA